MLVIATHCLLADHGFPDGRKALSVGRQVANQARERARHRNAPMFLNRKPRAQDWPHRHGKGLLKERRQAARLIRAGHDRHDLMTTPLQHLAHRDRLRHVAPALPLYGEHYFHGI